MMNDTPNNQLLAIGQEYTDKTATDKRTQLMKIGGEYALRQKQAARPQSRDIIDNVTTMITNPELAGQRSAWDLTIDALGVVTNPINDAWDAGLQMLGMEPAGRVTDTLSSPAQRRRASDSAAAAGEGCHLSIQPKIPMVHFLHQGLLSPKSGADPR